MTRWRAILGTVTAAALLAAGCSGSDEHPADEPSISEQLQELEPLPTVDPPADDQHPDRDPEAVTAALWELDPCRLIEPPPGDRGTIDQNSPHTCTLRIGLTSIDVDLGQRLEPAERYQLDATDVAGTKAYVVPGSEGLGGCTAWLPVSFTQAIRFKDEIAECGRVREVLRRAVKRFDIESSRQAVSGLQDTDTCALLRHGLGSEMRGREVAYGADDWYPGLDRCIAISEKLHPGALRADSGYAELELETYEDQALTLEEGATGTPRPADYAAAGWPADFGLVRGREVYGARAGVGGDCVMRWAESTTILQIYAPSCEQGRQIISRMTNLLDGPPEQQATPQGPILYRPDQPDRADRGVCVDYAPLSVGAYERDNEYYLPGPRCHRYVEPDLPDDGAETVVAAEADPNVTCALSADAVHDEFAQRLRPATLEADLLEAWTAASLSGTTLPPFRVRPCVFVDPQRQIQVQVFVSSDPMPILPDLADQLEENDSAMRTQLGSPIYRTGTGYLIGLGEHPDDPGYVAVFVGGRLDRTSGIGDYKPMRGSLDDVARVADTIVDEHLSS